MTDISELPPTPMSLKDYYEVGYMAGCAYLLNGEYNLDQSLEYINIVDFESEEAKSFESGWNLAHDVDIIDSVTNFLRIEVNEKCPMQKRVIIDISLNPFIKKGVKLWGSSILTINSSKRMVSIGFGHFKHIKK